MPACSTRRVRALLTCALIGLPLPSLRAQTATTPEPTQTVPRKALVYVRPFLSAAWSQTLGTPEAWASYVERLHEWLANDPADAWTGLRYAFNDRSDADQTSDNIGEWAGERRREPQLDVLRELASDVDRKIHELASLVDQLKATTLVGLLQQAESDPSALEGVLEGD